MLHANSPSLPYYHPLQIWSQTGDIGGKLYPTTDTHQTLSHGADSISARAWLQRWMKRSLRAQHRPRGPKSC